MNKKILLIVGAGHNDKCGIADYSYELVNAAPNDWEYLVWKDWKLKDIFRLIRLINRYTISSINLQYPTRSSYGSLVPHFLCIYYSIFTRKEFSITMHENMRMGTRYKLASNLFLLFANKVIFTTEPERKYALKFYPFRREHYYIIKIFSNIHQVPNIKPTSERFYDLTYFGLIEENRGIENLIQVVRKLQSIDQCQIRAAIIGMVSEKRENYAKHLTEISSGLKIDFMYNKGNEIVANLLNDSKYAYLPFTDGVSERRGSFLAAIINGAIPITTKGQWTPDSFDSVCHYIDDDGRDTIIKLLNDDSIVKITQKELAEFVNLHVANSWTDVSIQYKRIFKYSN